MQNIINDSRTKYVYIKDLEKDITINLAPGYRYLDIHKYITLDKKSTIIVIRTKFGVNISRTITREINHKKIKINEKII